MRPADLPLAQRLSPATIVLLVLALVLPMLVYRDTLMSMVEIWDRSETFTHQYLILPISLWLIWRQRDELRALAPQPFLPGLVVLALCSLGWLLGELADVQVVKHFALVTIMISAVITVLGLRMSRVIAFPLLFLIFAVPAGEVLIEPLIEFTADFTITALQLTGIPVWREGNTFVIPSGRWSVVEACSGVRYLIASLTLGVLYAHLSYRSRWRQAGFVLLSGVVPVIANGLRAYMIVMIGHLSSMQLAVGVDHLIYGWLFFGLVMFLMFWIGGFWIDSKKQRTDTPGAAPAAPGASAVSAAPRLAGATPARLVLAALLTVAAIGVGPTYAIYMHRFDASGAPVDLTTLRSNWNDSAAFSNWAPDFHPGVANLSRFYGHDGMQVGLYVRYYRGQHPGATLVSSVNRVLPEKNSPWIRTGNSVRTETVAGRPLALREEIISAPAGRMMIWRWYWIDRRFVENDYLAKLLQTKSQLEMQGDDGAALFVFTNIDEQPEKARQVLRRYLGENLAGIESTLNNNGKR
ncbi:exosortase A [Herbaspirillum sp. NPDC087042]|uniref:exosortase A n=1 Tax=Herbaspirillum sp. NPDC087042 TaxID=3364004 RepID=UPI0037FB36BB